MSGLFLFQNIVDIFFPAYCIGCKSVGIILCGNCLSENFIPNPKWETIEELKVWSAYEYSSKSHQKLVKRWKYGGDKQCIFSLINLVSFPEIHKDSVLMPIPLHKKRLNLRGYNQSEILAKEVGERCSLEVKNLLTRLKNTEQQAMKNKADRILNVKEAFKVVDNMNKSSQIILIDDVVTTGSTLKECQKALNKEGYYNISAMTLFRKPLG